MTELTTTSQIREDGRVLINKDTRNAGDIKPGDFLRLTIEKVDKKAFCGDCR